jgi:hypothetical protein
MKFFKGCSCNYMSDNHSTPLYCMLYNLKYFTSSLFSPKYMSNGPKLVRFKELIYPEMKIESKLYLQIQFFFLKRQILLTNKPVQVALISSGGKKIQTKGNRLPRKHRLEQKPLKNHP